MAQCFPLFSGHSLCDRLFHYKAQKQKEKRAGCMSLLPSQSHKYIKLKILLIVYLSHQTKVLWVPLNIRRSYVITSLFKLEEQTTVKQLQTLAAKGKKNMLVWKKKKKSKYRFHFFLLAKIWYFPFFFLFFFIIIFSLLEATPISCSLGQLAFIYLFIYFIVTLVAVTDNDSSW